MANEVVSMILEPDRRRQLGENGLFILWRDGRLPGRREGLACSMSMCPTPGCACEDVHVDGFVIDGQAGSVSRDVEGVHFIGPSGSTSARSLLQTELRAIVVPESGETFARPGIPEAGDPALLDWLASEMDEELLEALHRHRARAKGRAPEQPKKDVDLDLVKEYHHAPFDELFDGVRSDEYLVDGRRFWTCLFVCPSADCGCGELRVAFLEDVGPEAGGGYVLVDLTGSEGFKIVEIAAEDGVPKSLIRGLWAQFERRHDVGPYLRRREAQAKAVGATLWKPAAKPVIAAPKTERNAPCPCGSGLKFKRCCLGKQPSP